jgi:hypothetical protein
MFSQRASSVDRKFSRLAFITPRKRARKPDIPPNPPLPTVPLVLPLQVTLLLQGVATCYFAEEYFSAIVKDVEPKFLIGSRATRTFIPCARRAKWRGRGPIGGSDKCSDISGRKPSIPIIPHPSDPIPATAILGIERPSENRPASHNHSDRIFALTMGTGSARFLLQQVKPGRRSFDV